MSQFDELLAQLQAVEQEQSTLAKALPQEGGEDDEAIQAAAAEGAEGEENPEDKEDGEGGEKPMAKSHVLDGEEVEVVDAGELIKSLEGLTGRVDEQESVLAKGLGAVVGMLKSQSELIKSMQGQLSKLSGQGAGRKTVLTVMEKPGVGEQPLTKSQQDGQLTVGEFLAKSDAALQAKKINGLERTVIDVSVREGKPVDQGLIAKVLA